MAHPDSDGAAEMLEGGHRAMATAALRLAELYAQRMQIHARLREQQARAAADTDQRHAAIAAAAQTLNTGGDRSAPTTRNHAPDRETARVEAIREVTPDEFSQARVQAEQELAGTGTGVAGIDDEAVTRRQFEILESEAFVRAVLDDREQWEAREIAGGAPDRAINRGGELAAAEVWLTRTAPAEFTEYRTIQVGNDTTMADQTQENLVNRYESTPAGSRAATSPAQPGYDSGPARSARADTLDRAGLDKDIIESAMITDLGFGTPAAESVTSAATKSTPGTKARNRGAEREHQALGR